MAVARITDAERKQFARLQARAALAGHRVQLCEEECGKVTYFATAWGVSRSFERLSEVAILVDLVTGGAAAARASEAA